MAIQICNLCTVAGKKTIHKNLNWNIDDGEMWALVGKSGCGKTSLARVMVGIDPIQQGSIFWNGIEINPIGLWGMQFQSAALFGDMTVKENIAFSIRCMCQYASEKFLENSGIMFLHQVGLGPELMNLYPYQLSGGQQKLVGLARAIATFPKALLLDEPTAGLDPASASMYDGILQRFRELKPKTSVVVITHDLERIKKAENVAFMENKKIRRCSGKDAGIEWWCSSRVTVAK